MTGREEACIRLAKRVGLKGKSVLDIGCSIGWFPRIATSLDASQVCAIEPDAAKIKIAKKAAPKAKIYQGYAGSLNFPNKQFDVVTLFDVLEHVPKKTEGEVLKEIRRVLKSKGHLLIGTPNDVLLSNITDPAWYLGHRHYTKKALTNMLGKEGFKIKYYAVHGGFWEVVAMLVLYTTKWIFRIPMPFEEWFDIRRRKEFIEPGSTHISLIAQKD